MSAPLDTAQERLGWAKESICGLSKEVRAFIATKPFLGRIDNQSEPGWDLYQAELVKPIPAEWRKNVIDIAGHLRSPLDYAVNRVIQASPSAQQLGDKSQLSVYKSLENFTDEFKKTKIAKLLPDLAKFIADEIRPYNGGNHNLAYLNEINNIEKHWDIIGVAATQQPRSFVADLRNGNTLEVGVPEFKKGGDVLLRVSNEKPYHCSVEIAFNFALDGVRGLGLQPMIPTLAYIANEVERILSLFRQRFFDKAVSKITA